MLNGEMLVAVDGAELPALQHATNRRFSKKSPAEKEELYERIASQLMTIGDTYNISSSPHDSDSAGKHSTSVAACTVTLKITVNTKDNSDNSMVILKTTHLSYFK